jgi:hypothetical protein
VVCYNNIIELNQGQGKIFLKLQVNGNYLGCLFRLLFSVLTRHSNCATDINNKQYKIIGIPHGTMHVFLRNWTYMKMEHQAGIKYLMETCRSDSTHVQLFGGLNLKY